MTMQQALTALSEKLTELEQALDHLSWAIVQDQPPTDGGPSPAGGLDDLVQAMRGRVVEAENAVAGVQHPATGSHGLPMIRRSLVVCQRHCAQVTEMFHEQVLSPEKVSVLQHLTRGSDPDWRSWAAGVRDALEQCRQPLHGANQALLQCWQEVSELTDSLAVTVSPALSGINELAFGPTGPSAEKHPDAQ
jgi:hypothetical protein